MGSFRRLPFELLLLLSFALALVLVGIVAADSVVLGGATMAVYLTSRAAHTRVLWCAERAPPVVCRTAVRRNPPFDETDAQTTVGLGTAN